MEPVAPSAEGVRSLARFLAGEEASAGLVLLDAGAPARDRPARARRPYHAWKWVTLGLGAAAVGSGVTLVLLDRPEVEGGSEQPTVRHTLVPGIVAGAAGAALVATSVYLWVKDRPPARRRVEPAVVVVPGGAAVLLGGRF